MIVNAFFIALELPEAICQELTRLTGDLTGIHWLSSDQYHITLAYFGPVETEKLDDLVIGLRLIKHKTITVSLSSTGLHPQTGEPRAIVTQVNQSDSLKSLRKKINRTAIIAQLDRPRKRFHPHVTIGRFSSYGRVMAHPELLANYLTSRSSYKSKPFTLETFKLYSSRRTESGTEYEIEEQFTLS